VHRNKIYCRPYTLLFYILQEYNLNRSCTCFDIYYHTIIQNIISFKAQWFFYVPSAYHTTSRYSDGLRAGRPGFDSRQRQNVSLLYSVQAGSGAHPASYPMGIGAISPGVKRQGREADHSPPSNVVVRNCGAITPLPHMSS
jgi:hypothetical protein